MLLLQVCDDLLIQKVWPLNNLVQFTLFGDGSVLLLQRWRHNVKTSNFWLVLLVPGVLSDLVYRYSFLGVGNKNFVNHVFRFG